MRRLPETMRARFQKPFGPVLSTKQLLDGLEPGDVVVAVGDVVAKTLIEHGRDPKIIVIDYKTQRGGPSQELKETLGRWGQVVERVQNPPATITDALVDAALSALARQETTRIEVDGEEDLAGLPFIAHARDGTIVLYGMPNRGVVRVDVDAQARATARGLFDQMPTE